jgi:hypothetical protein
MTKIFTSPKILSKEKYCLIIEKLIIYFWESKYLKQRSYSSSEKPLRLKESNGS